MSRDDDGSYYLDKGPGCGGAALINDEYMSSHLEDRVRKATKITKMQTLVKVSSGSPADLMESVGGTRSTEHSNGCKHESLHGRFSF